MLATYPQLIQFASVTYTIPTITGLHNRFRIDWIIFLLGTSANFLQRGRIILRVPASRTLTRVVLLPAELRKFTLPTNFVTWTRPVNTANLPGKRNKGEFEKRRDDISCGSGGEKRVRFVHLCVKSLKLPKAARWRRISRSSRGWRAGETAGGSPRNKRRTMDELELNSAVTRFVSPLVSVDLNG